MDFISDYFLKFSKDCLNIPYAKIKTLVEELKELRENNGRLFILGVGGSAGNASHAVNDFRKLCNIEAYAPTDNVSELTARTNDEGFDTIFSEYLKVSKINSKDAIMIFSVGGGSLAKNVSLNLISAIKVAKAKQLKIFSLVGKDDGHIGFKLTTGVNIGLLFFILCLKDLLKAVQAPKVFSSFVFKNTSTKFGFKISFADKKRT